MAGDTDSVTIGHLQEMAPRVSNDHLTGDVTWLERSMSYRYIWILDGNMSVRNTTGHWTDCVRWTLFC